MKQNIDMKTNGSNMFMLGLSYWTTEVCLHSSVGWPWFLCFESMIRTDTAGSIGNNQAKDEGKSSI